MEIRENEQEFDPLAKENERARGQGGRGVAWLALLLALAAAGLAGWQWWQLRGSGDAASEQLVAVQQVQGEQLELGRRLGDLQARLDDLGGIEAELASLDAQLAGLESRIERNSGQRDAVREQMRGLEQEAQALGNRLEAAEASLAALAVRGESSGKRIELAEIDFLLRNASERLQLFGDRRGAAQALALADAQLTELDDPLYLPVRQAIASAQLALDEMPVVDLVTLTQGLAHLQAGIPNLPFAGEGGRGAPAVASEETGETAGIWARFTAALSQLVTVRRRVEEQQLISIEDKEYVRQGLWLQLESARLALLRLDEEAYTTSLQRAADTLQRYFEGSARQVLEAQDAIAGLAAAEISITPPDVSQPWGQLSRLRDDGQPTATIADEPEGGAE